MQLNGFTSYNKHNLPGNTSGEDYVNVQLKNCVPVNTVPIAPHVEAKPTQQIVAPMLKKETDASNFPKINI